jgi:hypothetical protein
MTTSARCQTALSERGPKRISSVGWLLVGFFAGGAGHWPVSVFDFLYFFFLKYL